VNAQISTPPSAPKKAARKAVTGTKVQGFFLQEFLYKLGQVLFFYFIFGGKAQDYWKVSKSIAMYNSITPSNFLADTLANSDFFVNRGVNDCQRQPHSR